MDKFFVMQDICKSFSGVEVLHHVDFSLEKGEVHALLGSNGAGKSTLIKIISGIHSSSSGSITFDGKSIAFADPRDAQRHGISLVPQEFCLVPTLTAMQNVFLGRESVKGGLLDEKTMRAEYEKICRDFGFDIPADEPVENLTAAQMQMIEIMKALSVDARIIIMDEPTTSLTNNEKAKLFEIIERLRDDGTTIIYISHILSEVFRLCDRATILRNGEIVGTWKVSELDFGSVCRYMSGSEVSIGARKQSRCRTNAGSVLEVLGLSRKGAVDDVSFSVRPGEIVGLAGLVGSGRTELARLIFGADKKSGGSIAVSGKEVRIKHPSDAVKSGIGFVAEDRKHEGLVLNMPIYQNMTLAKLRELFAGRLLNRKTELEYAEKSKTELSIKLSSVADPVETLSGGNQQKVVLAKWMLDGLKVLILDEPTKGIDIGAKEDVFNAVDSLAEKGIGIIFISSDLDEVFRVSDKLLIMDGGRVIKEMKNENVTEAEILDIVLRSREAQKGAGK